MEYKFRGIDVNTGEWMYGSLVLRKCDGFERTYIYDPFFDETEISEYITGGVESYIMYF